MGIIVMTPHKLFAVIGLHRAGTNLVQTLIHDNFKYVKFQSGDTYFWKHGFPPAKSKFNENCAHLFVIKNPYKWIESIAWRTTNDRLLMDFMKTNSWIDLKQGELIGDNQFNLDALCQVYLAHTKHWLVDSGVPNLIPIQYEAILQNHKHWLGLVQTKYGFERKTKTWTELPSKVTQSETSFDSKLKSYYLDTNYSLGFKHLSPELIERINHNLTDHAFKFLQYEKCEPLAKKVSIK